MDLEALLNRIVEPDQSVAAEAQAHLDNLTKPRGSLGRLEELARWLCVVRGTTDISQPRPAVGVFAADHGVCAAGVSLFPQEVTAQMVYNFLRGGAGINVFARQVGADVVVVDVGVAAELADAQGLIKAKVAPGTADMTRGPAMSRDQALKAIGVGTDVAARLISEGYDLLVPGEMGIGNTTAASAITAVLCARAVAEVTGRGTGLDDEALRHKIGVIEKAIATNRPDPGDALGVLAAVGGLEIAAICGLILEAAASSIPVVLVGFISTAGALVAAKLKPEVVHYLLAGHCSVEAGHKIQLETLGLKPLLNLELRLGEGTGGVLAVGLVRAAVAMFTEMATFESAGVSDEKGRQE